MPILCERERSLNHLALFLSQCTSSIRTDIKCNLKSTIPHNHTKSYNDQEKILIQNTNVEKAIKLNMRIRVIIYETF